MSKPRLWTLSSESLITTIKLKLNPHENDWIGYASEELLRRAHAPLWLGTFYRESIVRFGGIDLILKIIHLWEKDESLPALLLKLLLQLLKVSVVSEQIIKSGGKETIERIIEIHEEDKEVRADGRKLLRHLELVAKNIAIRDIGYAHDAIVYNIPIDVIRACKADNNMKRINQFNDNDLNQAVSQSKNHVAIQTLIQIMNENIENDKIQEKGLETIIFVAKDNISSRAFVDLGGIPVLLNGMSTHSDLHRIGWRGCVAITTFCKNNLAICSDLRKQGVCEVIMNVVMDENSPIEVKQQALWAISYLCQLDHCIVELEKFDLKIFLRNFYESSQIDTIKMAVPLRLRQLYSLEDLENMSFTQNKEPINTNQKSPWRGLPKETIKGSYGNVDDIFEPGEPGLV